MIPLVSSFDPDTEDREVVEIMARASAAVFRRADRWDRMSAYARQEATAEARAALNALRVNGFDVARLR